MPRCGERCSHALRSISHTAVGGVRLPLTFTCCGDSTYARSWPRAWMPSEPRAGRSDKCCNAHGSAYAEADGPRQSGEARKRRTPRTTRDSGHRAAAPAAGPAPWEGPLVSETIDLFSGSTGEPEESPSLSRSAGQSAGVAPSAGTSPAQAGAVRSWPDADDGTVRGHRAQRGQAGRRGSFRDAAARAPAARPVARPHRDREDAQGRARRGDRGAAARPRRSGCAVTAPAAAAGAAR